MTAGQGIVGHVEQSVDVQVVTLGQEQSVFMVTVGCVAQSHSGATVVAASVVAITVGVKLVVTVPDACVVQSPMSAIGSCIFIFPFFICKEKLIFIICVIKVINHGIFRNLKAFLYGEEHRMYFLNIPVFMSREKKNWKNVINRLENDLFYQNFDVIEHYAFT